MSAKQLFFWKRQRSHSQLQERSQINRWFVFDRSFAWPTCLVSGCLARVNTPFLLISICYKREFMCETIISCENFLELHWPTEGSPRRGRGSKKSCKNAQILANVLPKAGLYSIPSCKGRAPNKFILWFHICEAFQHKSEGKQRTQWSKTLIW